MPSRRPAFEGIPLQYEPVRVIFAGKGDRQVYGRVLDAISGYVREGVLDWTLAAQPVQEVINAQVAEGYPVEHATVLTQVAIANAPGIQARANVLAPGDFYD